jgi:hypothetical protein
LAKTYFNDRIAQGSSNAKLVHNATETYTLAERAFSSGLSAGHDVPKRGLATSPSHV